MACSSPPFFEHALDYAIPLSMQWDLTWRCDHQCVHCYLTDRRQAELSYDEGVDLLDQLAQAGVMMLLISGGDPFLRPDALDLLKAASQRGFDLKINTHGNFIDEDLADELVQLTVSRVSLSVYSIYQDEHEAITLIKGSHQKTLNAACLLIERGIEVNFKTPVMLHNRTGWEGVGPLAEEMGAKWEVDGHIIADDQSDFGLCKIGVDPTDRVLAVLNAMAPHRHAASSFEHLPPTPSSARTCSAGTVSGYVSPDGRIFPCINWREEMGAIREHGFSEIWHQSPVAQKQREVRRASYLQDCQGCAFHHHCNYCPGISHAETGDATRRSAYVCERTHITMGAIEYLTRLNDEQKPIPKIDSSEALELFNQPVPFAQRQWAARSAGVSRPSDGLYPQATSSSLPLSALVQITDPRST